MMIHIELLTTDNFPDGALDNYARTQQVRRAYRRSRTGYALVEQSYTEDWTIKQKHDVERVLRGPKHLTYLAFDRGEVIGFISLKKRLIDGWMIVDQMQVSAPYRGKGIGRRLFEMGESEALKMGAKGLYISASSSEETVAFYKAMGAELTDEPIREFADAEPFDLQMVWKAQRTDFET